MERAMRRRVGFQGCGAILAALVLSSCSRSQASSTMTLTLTGSSTIAPLALEIAKRFEVSHPGTRIDVQSGGTSRGVSDVRQGLAQIGMVSRGLKPDENDLMPVLIARDGVAMIVHATNPVAALTKAQVVSIYKGETAAWDKVGGPARPVTVVNKAEGRSTLEIFLHYFALNGKDVKAHVIVGENAQAIKTVIGNPDAIAYVSIGTAEFEKQNGAPIKLVPVDGVVPSTSAVADSSYPIARQLNLVTRGNTNDLTKTFLAYAGSKDVADLIEAQHFVRPTR